MVIRADHERVKSLLRETVTLLCKNGLTYKKKLSLDAVIGVTLDDDDVFFVSINERVSTAGMTSRLRLDPRSTADQQTSLSQEVEEEDGMGLLQCCRDLSYDLHQGEERLQEGDDGGSDSDCESDSNDRYPGPSATVVKTEPPDPNSNSADNIVFVKDDVDICWEQVRFPEAANCCQDRNKDDGMSAGACGDCYDTISYTTAEECEPEAPGEDWAQGIDKPPETDVGQEMARKSQTGSKSAPKVVRTRIAHKNKAKQKHYDCDICQKNFQWKHHLKRHRNTHFGIFPFMCPHCNHGCLTRPHLEGHIQSRHTGAKKNYKCISCNTEFRYKSSLYNHIACGTCNKRGGATASDVVATTTQRKQSVSKSEATDTDTKGSLSGDLLDDSCDKPSSVGSAQEFNGDSGPVLPIGGPILNISKKS